MNGVIDIREGDCLTLLKDVPDASIDMILCDLPYGTTANKWDTVIPLDPLWREYWRVAKPHAAVVLTASQPFTSTLVVSQMDNFRHEWVWIKNRGSNFANTVREPMKEHESVLVFSRGKWIYNKQMQARTGSGGDRVKYGVAFKSKSSNYRDFEGREHKHLPEMRVPSSWQKFNTEVGLHPTQKPVDLFRYLIRTYSNHGDVVLDSCIGSGTTAVAALWENRGCIGMEMDPVYARAARQRAEKTLGEIW